jgi:hypothetical protein
MKIQNRFRIKSKKGFAPAIIIGVIAIIALGFMINSGMIDVGTGIGSDDFVKPYWGRLACEPDSNNIQNSDKYLDQQTIFKCDGFTEQCDYIVYCNAVLCNGQFQVCNIDGTGCGTSQQYTYSKGSSKTLTPLSSGKAYKFSSSLGLAGYIHIKQTWTPWKLFRYTGAKKDIVNSFDCSLRSGDLSNVPAADKVDKLQRQGGPGASWVNYVDDWVYGPGTNVFNHPQYGQVYCTGGQIYEIVKLQMADGSLKKLDPTYKGITESGRTYNGLGKILSGVECCPNEPSCSSDFKFVSKESPQATQNQPNSCFSDIQCYNAAGPVPKDSYSYTKFSCTGGTCIESAPIKVDCTTNAQCGNNQICDLSTMNYGKCITQKADFCGDGTCNKVGGENYQYCPADCAIDCPPGQQVIVENSNTGTFCFFGYGLCDKSQKQYCGTPGFNWTNIFFWLIIAGIIVIAIWLFPVIRVVLKGIPYIGRFIP